MALEHFKRAVRDLAPTQAQIADHLDVSVKTVERFLDGELSVAVRTLMRAPGLLLALARDAATGDLPTGTTHEQRRFKKNSKQQPTKRRRHPKQSTVRL